MDDASGVMDVLLIPMDWACIILLVKLTTSNRIADADRFLKLIQNIELNVFVVGLIIFIESVGLIGRPKKGMLTANYLQFVKLMYFPKLRLLSHFKTRLSIGRK